MNHPSYYAYLLRIWCASDQDGMHWLASLEDPHTHQVQGFANLEQMAAFLQQKTEIQPTAAQHKIIPDGHNR